MTSDELQRVLKTAKATLAQRPESTLQMALLDLYDLAKEMQIELAYAAEGDVDYVDKRTVRHRAAELLGPVEKVFYS